MKKQFFTKKVWILLLTFKTLLVSLLPQTSHAGSIKQIYYAENLNEAQYKRHVKYYEEWVGHSCTRKEWIDEQVNTFHWYAENIAMSPEDKEFFAHVNPGQILTMVEQGHSESPTLVLMNSGFNIVTRKVLYTDLSLNGDIPVFCYERNGMKYAFGKVNCMNFGRAAWGVQYAPAPEVITNTVKGDSIPYPVETVVEKETFIPQPYEVAYEVPVYVGGGGMCCGGGNVSMNNGNVFAPTTIINDDHSVHIDSHDHIIPPGHPVEPPVIHPPNQGSPDENPNDNDGVGDNGSGTETPGHTTGHIPDNGNGPTENGKGALVPVKDNGKQTQGIRNSTVPSKEVTPKVESDPRLTASASPEVSYKGVSPDFMKRINNSSSTRQQNAGAQPKARVSSYKENRQGTNNGVSTTGKNYSNGSAVKQNPTNNSLSDRRNVGSSSNYHTPSVRQNQGPRMQVNKSSSSRSSGSRMRR